MPRPSRLTALTFDFWNTLYSADNGSWENGGSWAQVRPRRIQSLREMLGIAGVHPCDNDMDLVYQSGFDAYMAAWTCGRHFGAREEVTYFLQAFAIDETALPDGVVTRTVLEIENAARTGALPLLAGVAETIPYLAASGYKLGLISDTSLTPGRILREFMEQDGLLEHFSVLTFSDETGYPKPDRRMFASTLAGLDAEPAQAAHVGDTPRTDIAGAKAVGMVTIRCANVVDHPEPPEADFVISDHREIPAILERLG